MNRMPLLKSVMTPFPWWIDIDEPVEEARAMMQKHQVRHLPVKERGKLASVVTERDLNLALESELRLPPGESLKVRDVSVDSVYVVEIDTRLEAMLETMAERRIGSALVIRDGSLVGIFTAMDACRVLASILHHLRGDDLEPRTA
ncbi:MAG: CBS domain-containing protein [Gammaproteobacteria bacterium]|nr:MAG: CBS domain-containing protein [Gammaproteobacteria bacterium]